MRRSLALAALPALLALAACSGGGATSALPAATSAAPDATLGPLTPGTFPATPDGREAKAACQAWAGLRATYAKDVQDDSPVQLTQWLNGPDWTSANAAITKLGNSAAFTSLEAAWGVATVASTASIAGAQNIDKACEAG